MSLMVRLELRSTILSLVEMILFFGVISAAYLLGTNFIFAVVADRLGRATVYPFWDVAAWFRAPPWWAYALEGAGYLALLTIYWSPGDEEQNRAEVRAFGVFLMLVAAAAGWWVNHWWM